MTTFLAPTSAHAGAVLLSDLRQIDASAFASASTGTDTDMQSDQATFGESPFNSTVEASAHEAGGRDGPANAFATTTQRTEFAPTPSNFETFTGSGSLNIVNIPNTSDGSGAIHNVVDITFHLDVADLFVLSGTLPSLVSHDTIGVTTSVLFTQIGGSVILNRSQSGSFFASGTLPPGDYRFAQTVAVDYAQDQGAFGAFGFTLRFGVVPEPSNFVLASLGLLSGIAVALRKRNCAD